MKKKRLQAPLLLAALLSAPFAHAGTVQTPQTGMQYCYDSSGGSLNCAGTGQDGEYQIGATWPGTRFVNNANGTITDNLTGLVWLQKSNCSDSITVGGVTYSPSSWEGAMTWSKYLSNGYCGLTDGSTPGQWRIANRRELMSLLNRGQWNNTSWLGTQGFTNINTSSLYGTSDTVASSTTYTWGIDMSKGYMNKQSKTATTTYWAVRNAP